jgi:hypothetical protein
MVYNHYLFAKASAIFHYFGVFPSAARSDTRKMSIDGAKAFFSMSSPPISFPEEKMILPLNTAYIPEFSPGLGNCSITQISHV